MAKEQVFEGVDFTGFDIKKRAMLEALVKTLGVVSYAAPSAQITRQTHYNWLLNDPDYKLAVDSIQELALDFAESKLMEKMRGIEVMTGYDKNGEPIIYSQPPSDTALIFYLKTKGKKRGYIERTEFDHLSPLPVVWNEERTYETKQLTNSNGH